MMLSAVWSALAVAYAASATPRTGATGHVVARIAQDGRPVAAAPGVVMTSHAGTVTTAIRRGDFIPDGTRVDVPAHIVVVVAGTSGKSTVVLDPGSSVSFLSTSDSGELLAAHRGRSTYSVVTHSLDFFRVQTGESLTAAAHGTAFSVGATDRTLDVRCSRGVVNVVELGYVRIGLSRKPTSLTRPIASSTGHRVVYERRTLWELGRFAAYKDAETWFRAQLAAARRAHDPNAVSVALKNLGNVQTLRGRYLDALRSYAEALLLFRRAGDDDDVARTLNDLAVVERGLSRYASAAGTYSQALTTARRVRDRDSEAGILAGMATLRAVVGDPTGALSLASRAVTIHRLLDDHVAEARDLLTIAGAQSALRRYAAAELAVRQALQRFRAAGDRGGEALALMDLGNLSASQGRIEEALTTYERALAEFQRLGDGEGAARTNLNIGIAYEGRAKYEEALPFFARAVQMFQASGDRDGEARTLSAQGVAQQGLGQNGEARSSHQAARTLYRALGDTARAAAEQRAIDANQPP